MANVSWSSDLGKLGRLIVLPEIPVRGKWQAIQLGKAGSGMPGPDDWALVATVEYDEAGFGKVQEAFRGKDRVMAEVLPQVAVGWLEEEAMGLTDRLPGGGLRWKADAFDAARFARPPLSHGYAVPIGAGRKVFLLLATR